MDLMKYRHSALLHLLLFIGTTQAADTRQGRRRATLGHAEEHEGVTSGRKSTRRQYMPLDEMDDFIWAKFQQIENYKKSCSTGEFLSFVTKSCEDCNKYCKNGQNMNNCGRECIEYFNSLQTQELKQRLQETKSDVVKMMEKQKETSDLMLFVWIAIGIIFVATIAIVAVMIAFGVKHGMTKRRK